jgi:hypothetical protein
VTRQGVGLPAKHLLTVWNPAYAADPLDAHLAILLEWAERYRSGACGEDDVYVWWAKLRSPNRDTARDPLRILQRGRDHSNPRLVQ